MAPLAINNVFVTNGSKEKVPNLLLKELSTHILNLIINTS